MTLIGNVCYIELNSGNFNYLFIIELKLLKSELCCVLCEVEATMLATREISNHGNTRKDRRIYSNNWRLDAIHGKNKPVFYCKQYEWRDKKEGCFVKFMWCRDT